jgi:hypothetical protein
MKVRFIWKDGYRDYGNVKVPLSIKRCEMNRQEARRRARMAAWACLRNLVDSGWPYRMRDGDDPQETDVDLQRMVDAMEEIIARMRS